MTAIIIKLKEFHKKFDLLFLEQYKLPRRKGNKDYSEVEVKIEAMSRILIRELTVYKRNIESQDKSAFPEIDNIIAGCERLIQNPYKRFGGPIAIDQNLFS